MTDAFLLLTPFVLLGLLAVLGFIGCRFRPGAAVVSAPTNLKAVPGDTWVKLSWDSYANATGFTLHRGTVSGNYSTTFDIGGSATSFLDAPVTNGTPLFYALTVTTVDGTSGDSNEAQVTPASIDFVQLIQKDVTVAGNSVTSNPFTNPVTQGNMIVVWIWYKVAAPGQVSAVTDSANNIYTGPIVGPTAGAGALAGFQQELWYAQNVTAGTGVTVTANFSAATTERAVSAHEYSGANPGGSFVNTPVVMTGNSANATIGPLDTGDARMIFAAALFPTQGAAGPDFNSRSTLRGNSTEDRRVTLPGSFNADFTNTVQDWLAQMVTFK